MAIRYPKITSKKKMMHLNATQKEQTTTISNWHRGQTNNGQGQPHGTELLSKW
jgi:hypothetical protein